MLTPPTITPRMNVSTAGRVRSLIISAIMQNNAENRIGQGGDASVGCLSRLAVPTRNGYIPGSRGGETRDAAQLNLVRFCATKGPPNCCRRPPSASGPRSTCANPSSSISRATSAFAPASLSR